MGNVVLVLGGVRSGKSRFAQQLAQRLAGERVLFVATAEAGDAEMARRIAIHRQSRPAGWGLLEVTHGTGPALAGLASTHGVILLDCLTFLVSNVLLNSGDPPVAEVAEERARNEVGGLLDAALERAETVIIVSGEVGMGVVPEHPLGRLFRDLLGWANQAVAARSVSTYLMVAGLPVEVKSLAASIEQAAQRCLE